LLDKFEEVYPKLKKMLNDKVYKFSVNELRQITENSNDFHSFTELCRELTICYKGGQNLVKHINEFRSTEAINNGIINVNKICLHS